MATGSAPFDASQVLEKLNAHMDSLPPLEILSPRPLSSGSDSDPNTLWTLSKFTKPQSRIKKSLVLSFFTNKPEDWEDLQDHYKSRPPPHFSPTSLYPIRSYQQERDEKARDQT